MDDSADLYTVQLIQGLTVKNLKGRGDGVYKIVCLRESCERFLHDAIRQVQEMRRGPDNSYHLVHNQALYEAARIVQHIDKFVGGGPDLHASDIDLSVLGNLHPLDVMLIQEKLFCIEIAAQVRWGLMDQEEADLILNGRSTSKPVSPAELLQTLKKIIDRLAMLTKTPLDVLRVMPISELEATVKNITDTDS